MYNHLYSVFRNKANSLTCKVDELNRFVMNYWNENKFLYLTNDIVSVDFDVSMKEFKITDIFHEILSTENFRKVPFIVLKCTTSNQLFHLCIFYTKYEESIFCKEHMLIEEFSFFSVKDLSHNTPYNDFLNFFEDINIPLFFNEFELATDFFKNQKQK